MGEERLAACVHALEQIGVRLVRALTAEADDREGTRRDELPTRLVPHPAFEDLRQPRRLEVDYFRSARQPAHGGGDFGLDLRVDVGVVCLFLGRVAERRFIARRLALALINEADKLMYEAKGERASHIYLVRVKIDNRNVVIGTGG